MNIIISGPQGSGKGTQAKLLVKKLGLFHQDNGSMLRKIAKTDEKVKDMMNKGILIPDDDMIKLMDMNLTHRIDRHDDIVFDGYPRTIDQYEALKDWLEKKDAKLDFAIIIEIGEKETIRRLSARRVHGETGEIYNLITKKPPSDIDEKMLVQRDDDKPDAIKKRLALYNEKTKPLIAEYEKDGILVKIDGERAIDEIHTDILEKLKKIKK